MDFYGLGIAVVRSGVDQEGVEQPVRGRSVQADYLANHGEGINHLGFIVEDCQRLVQALQARGFRVITGGGRSPAAASSHTLTPTRRAGWSSI